MVDQKTKVVTELYGVLEKYYWSRLTENEQSLRPIGFMFDLIDLQVRMNKEHKECMYEVGAEFNRFVVDATGRRHNDSVEEANDLYKAGRSLAKAVLKLSAEERESWSRDVQSDIAEMIEGNLK